MSLQTEISERRGALVRLVALYRNARQPIRQLTKTITILGRDEACDIILASRSVGPVHAAIVRSANTAYVCDLGAESGSIIGERRVRWARLSDGQELVLGRFRFRIELDEPDSGAGEDLPLFKLTAQQGGQVVSSSDPVLLIGRDACCDLVLDAPDVAPCHCLVAWTQDGPAVRDLGAEAGTRHQYRSVSFGRLMSGDVIGVGPFDFVFEIGQGEADAATTRDSAPTDNIIAAASRDASDIVSGRMGGERLATVAGLWTPSPSADAAPTKGDAEGDLDRLDSAAAEVAAIESRLESRNDDASALAELSRRATGERETAAVVSDADAALRVTRTTGTATLVAQADRSGSHGPSETRPPAAKADDADRESVRARILAQAAQLQRRRDQDRLRSSSGVINRSTAGGTIGVEPIGEIGSADLDPPARSALAAPSSDQTGRRARFDGDPAGSPTAPHADRVGRERELERAVARLEMELAQARDGIGRTREKYAALAEQHGSIEARKKKLDQRVTQLRDRVTAAQDALDERARKIRAGLEKERERLRLRQAELQKQAAELEASIREKNRTVEHRAHEKTAELEAERAELLSLSESLERREEEIEARRQVVGEQEQELEETVRATLAQHETELQSRLHELDERAKSQDESAEQKAAESDRQLESHRVALEGEFETRTTELQKRQDAAEASLRDTLSHRETRLEGRQKEVEEEGRHLREKLETVAAKRESELSEQRKHLEQRRQEIEAEHKAAVARQEAALARRLGELDEITQARLDKRADELSESTNAKLADFEIERAALQSEHQAKLTALNQREEDLDRINEQFVVRDSTLTARAGELDEREKSLEQRTAELAGRDDELARMSAALDIRDQRLGEWQTRVDSEKGDVSSSQADLDTARSDVVQREAALQKRVTETADRSEVLDRENRSLQEDRQTHQTRIEGLEAREAELAARGGALDRRKEELDGEAARLSEAEDQFRKLEERSRELDDQNQDIEKRTEALMERDQLLNERIASYEREVDGLEKSRDDFGSVRQAIDDERRELETYAAVLDQRTARTEEIERRARDARAEQVREREELDDVRARLEARAAQLEVRHREASEQDASLDEARVAHDLDRTKLVERESECERARAELEREQTRLETDRSELDVNAAGIERDNQHLDAAREETAAKTATLEAGLARLERDQVAVKDHERALAAERARVESAQRDAEKLRNELKSQVEENDQAQQSIDSLTDRQRDQEARLALETEALEERGRTLDRRFKETRSQHREVDQLRSQIEDERRALARDRNEFDASRASLEQSRSTFQAGLRDLESREQGLAHRESELSARAEQLEAYRARLETDGGELDQQRETLSKAQADDSAESQHLSVLLEETETRREALREREEELGVHEKALEARAAELAASEDEIQGRTQGLDGRAAELDENGRVLAAEREEFTGVVRDNESEAASQRRQDEKDIEETRAELEDERHRLDAEFAERLREAEAETAGRDEQRLAALRQKAEREFAEREARLRVREAEVEHSCRTRVEQTDRDINQRLAQLEESLKRRREEAGHAADAHRQDMSQEAGQAESRAVEEVQELRRRQAALDEERSHVRELRRQLETDRAAFESERAALITEDEPQVEDDRWRDVDSERAALASRTADVDRREARLDERSQLIRDALAALRQFRERLVAGDESSADAEGPVARLMEELARREGESGPPSLDGSGESPDPYLDQALVVTPILSTEAATLQPAGAPAAADLHREPPPSPPRKFPVVRAISVALVFGSVVGALVHVTSSPPKIEVAGELALRIDGSPATLTAGEHIDRLVSGLPEASIEAESDFYQMYQDNDLRIKTDGDAVRLSIMTPPADRARSREWIDQYCSNYVLSLGRKPDPDRSINERIGTLNATRARTSNELQKATNSVKQTQAELNSDPRLRDIDATREEKAGLKTELEDAIQKAHQAEQALRAVEATPEPTGPITPTPAERTAAYQSDPDLVQAIEEERARAREFHGVLSRAMSQTQGPMAALLTSVERFSAEIDNQRRTQTDQEILGDVEQIAVDLTDFAAHATTFAEGWDDLAPKVAAWKPAENNDVLLEYQKRGDELVRAFDKQGRETLLRVASGIGALDRGGAEPTKRKNVKAALLELVHEADKARQDLLFEAVGVVRANNFELRALANTIRSLGDRIRRQRSAHDEALAAHLIMVRRNERAARIQSRRDALAEAGAVHDEKQRAFMAIDNRVTADDAIRSRAEQLRRGIDSQSAIAVGLRRDIGQIDKEIERVKKSRTVSMAGAAEYRPIEVDPPADYRDTRMQAVLIWGIAAALFTLFAMWVATRAPKPMPAPVA